MLIRKSFFCLYLFVIVTLVLFSCNQQDKMEIEKSASAFDIKQGEASVLQSNQNFMKSFKRGDSIAVSNCYTTDARILADHSGAIIGRNKIVHFISEEMLKGISGIDLHTTKIWGDSTILAEEGTYETSNKDGGHLDKGKYIVLWKQEAGNWKMYRDIRTSDLPLPGMIPKKIGRIKH